jgi:thiamine biosynthesis lipoprotein
MATASDRLRRAKPLLGTFVEIELAGAAKPEMNAAIDAAFDAVARVHRLMSFHERDSDVSRLNRDAYVGPVGVDAWTFEVLEAAVEMHQRSNGIFDVAVAPVLQALGLLPNLRGDAPIAGAAQAFDAIELRDGQTVRFRHADVRIDLGGIAKGFAVDRALGVLRGSGATSGLVNAGGDLAVFGPEPQIAHIRHPRDPRGLVCSVEIVNEALASTARRFDPFRAVRAMDSAIIDPGNRKPARGIEGTTVRAHSCMIADALTKIVMIAGTEATGLLEHYHASALLVAADGDVQITPDWQHAVHLAA